MSSSAPCAPSNRMRCPDCRFSFSTFQTGCGVRQDLRRDLAQLRRQSLAVDRLEPRARGAARRGARAAGPTRGSSVAVVGQIRHAGPCAGRPCPRRPGRCRARWCRSWRRRRPPRARGRARRASAGSAACSRRSSASRGVISTPCSRDRSISSIRCPGVQHHAVADHAELAAAHDARGQQRQLEDLAVDDQRVARRCARPGSGRSRRPARRASRRSCLCPRRPTGRRPPPHWPCSFLSPVPRRRPREGGVAETAKGQAFRGGKPVRNGRESDTASTSTRR